MEQPDRSLIPSQVAIQWYKQKFCLIIDMNIKTEGQNDIDMLAMFLALKRMNELSLKENPMKIESQTKKEMRQLEQQLKKIKHRQEDLLREEQIVRNRLQTLYNRLDKIASVS